MRTPGTDPVALGALELVSSQRNTTVRLPSADVIGTVEHVLACLHGLRLEAVVITVDGPEMPGLDGSAAPLCAALLAAGMHKVAPSTPPLRLLQSVRVERGDAYIELAPDDCLSVACSIVFDELPPEVVTTTTWHDEQSFVEHLAPARTFAFASWLDSLVRQGLARGGSLANAVVFDAGAVRNPEGLRFDDEPTRHKVLDLVGDLALLGQPLLARINAHKPGHQLNASLLRALRAQTVAGDL